MTELLASLKERGPSVLSRHASGLCCASALAWFRAMARATPGAIAQPPVWISRHWRWGPSRWPLHWCEAVRAETLDCGALSELAVEALRGCDTPVVKVQLVQEWGAERLAHWHARWASAGTDTSWIEVPFAYHEVVGVLRGSALTVWDPADGLWKDGGQPGHGRVVAIRLITPTLPCAWRLPDRVLWNGAHLREGEWYETPAFPGEGAAEPGTAAAIHTMGVEGGYPTP